MKGIGSPASRRSSRAATASGGMLRSAAIRLRAFCGSMARDRGSGCYHPPRDLDYGAHPPIDRPMDHLRSLRVAILVEDNYEDLELQYPRLRLLEAGVA